MIGLTHFLILGTALFGIGLYGALTRRNAVGILMSIELIFNSVNVNLVAFGRFVAPWAHSPSPLTAAQAAFTGQIFSIFIIAIAAAEAAVGLALVFTIYRNFKTIDVDNIHLMKW